MRFSWLIFGTLIGGMIGFLFQPMEVLGRPHGPLFYAWPMFGAMIGLVLGIIADCFKLR